MSTDQPFRTDYEFLKGVEYIFVSLDRNLSGEECHELAEKYFETHEAMTLPGQALRIDLRPAFRKPLADVTPKFRAVSIGHTFTPQRWASACMARRMQGTKQSARPSFSAAHMMPICVYDQAGNVIAADEHAAQFKEW
jgi:hypothetical protein